MTLRELLDLCQDIHSHDWIDIGGRPATTMVAGVFDPGMKDAATRTLEGHSMAIYEPDPRLAIAWPVPEEPEGESPDRLERHQPEWAEQDWRSARGGYAVVLYGGAPVWQTYLYYLDWGSGVGGYVPSFDAVYAKERIDGIPQIERWETTKWEVGLAGLINAFSSSGDWLTHDPTGRIVPEPSSVHPLDKALRG